MKKIIALILALVSCFSVLLTACGDNGSSSSDGGSKTYTPEAKRRYQGTHIFNVSESDSEYLVQNSSTQYKILLPAEQTTYTDIAASELSTLLNEATGATLTLERETGDGYTHNASQKYISIGNTGLFKSTGLTADAKVLKREGYRIVTKDNNIYVFSAYDVGNLYGVYELMEILFNFEYFYVDCYEIDENVTNKKLPILDVTDVPDFETRNNATALLTSNNFDNNAKYRMRFSTERYSINLGDEENGYAIKSFHNTANILPKGVATDEPEWHADTGNQLCYTAHGDAESYERMVKRTAHVVEQQLKKYPTKDYPSIRYATISCEDEHSCCTCEACGESSEKYGGNSAAIILFMSDVREEIENWMNLPENEAYKRDEFYLMFFAYMAYLGAPTHYDEAQGKYVLNEGLEFNENVGVMYAINDVTSTVSMYHENNAQTRKNSEMWFDVAPAMYIWTYSGNLTYSAAMWPKYEHLNEDGYNFYATGNSIYFTDYIDYGDVKHTGFKALALYIDSQMLWDCSQSIADLKAKWFNAMFGEASDVMRELFEKELLYVTQVYEAERVSHGWGVPFSASDWSLSELESWIRLIQKAMEKAASIYKEAEPETFEMIQRHIQDEFYFPALALVMSNTKETGGQIYIDTVKYLQANLKYFSGHRLRWGSGDDTNVHWKDLIV